MSSIETLSFSSGYEWDTFSWDDLSLSQSDLADLQVSFKKTSSGSEIVDI
ncbi:hypothetical protein LCGC14_2980320, partial [marine sediment metagenome]